MKQMVGRVVRDIERKMTKGQENLFKSTLEVARRLLVQDKNSKNKIYSVHAPEVYCVAKGKANKKYEFGCKVALAVTHKQGLVLSSKALEGPIFDGHTLENSLQN